MSDAVYLNALGLTCSLGRDVDTVAQALFSRAAPGGLTTTDRYTPGRPLALGEVAGIIDSLVAFPLILRGRNNVLLHHAFSQIETQVAMARERHGATRIAVIVGTSTSGIGEAERALARGHEHEWADDFHYAQQEISAPSRLVATLAASRGPAYTVSTACSSGAKALAAGARLLRAGIVDAVIAGGSDSLCGFTLAGFSALEAISPAPSQPFSRNRSGINIGEGAALFLMTREPGPVRLAGWGESSDAHHMSAPDPQGTGAMQAIAQGLQRAGISPTDVDYVNLHGTATLQNDAMEARAIAATLGAEVPASSTKPLTGHTLGASGAIEAGLTWIALAHNPHALLPPHWYDGDYDPDLPRIDLIEPGRNGTLRYALSNSFAFGGSNAVLVLGAE